MSLKPPVAAKHPVTRSFHGDDFVDDYEWLRDKTNPEVIAHLEAENAYADALAAPLAGLRQEIFDDISARTQQTDLSVPAHVTHVDDDGEQGWWYYSRTVEGKDYPIHCRVADLSGVRPDLSGEVAGEQVLLDGNAEAEGHEFFALGGFSVSPDGQLLAWSVDHAGDERFTSYLRDLDSGEDFGPIHTDLSHGLCWAGNQHIVYSLVDEAWRPFQVWSHRLQTDPSKDVLLLQEDDERFWLGVDESRDRNHLLFMAGSKLTSECWLLPTDDPEGTPTSVAGRVENVEYQVEPAGDQVLVLHNRDCADYSLATAPLHSPGAEHWTTVVAGQPGVRLESVEAYAGHAVLTARRDGLSTVAILDRAGEGFGEPRWVDFDEELYDVQPYSEPDWGSTTVRLQYTSLITPASVLELDLTSGDTTLLRRTPVLEHPTHGAYDPADYVQRRLWATAEDGTRIPISLVHRRDVVPDGSAPCLLYGYGSYEVSIPPSFSIARLSLLQRGIVFAIAHVRGGGEMGRAWYDQGKQLTKPNSFSDFVTCGRHLVEQGWTSPDRLAARGRSAGGLLMGAITNLAPELFRAVHAGVPFVDALTSILKPELPLTVVEWEEWGNPIEDPEVYACMKSYTPYENIRAERYPAILATTSLNDTRVLFTEPAKWVARLRETVVADPERPILLKTEMVAGHGGVSGRYGSWREEAFELAWIISQISQDHQA
ncbi:MULTISPECIES: S9 family peptidase [unclassified Luteococcus]|uniref:S9 family peptidase n=1 Tax=unclassified Luteococcus TaxID=2639923 RepID=UPI00313D3946